MPRKNQGIMNRNLPKRIAWTILVMSALLAQSASATQRPRMSVEEMLERSQAAFIGTAIDIDDTAGTGGEAMTTVTFSVSEVLFGKIEDSEVEFTMRGGWLPTGQYEKWSTVPVFSLGDTYLLFIRKGDYTVQPMVRSSSAILRLVDFKGRSSLVDEHGFGVTVADDHVGATGTTGKIALTMADKRTEQRDALQSSHAGPVEAESVDSRDINHAATKTRFTDKLKELVKRVRKSKRRFGKTRRPGSLHDRISKSKKWWSR